tara:strand:+ start:616 stop:945 length:330 start_codon:yes stop_codon:yes gene_type:complete
MEINIVYLVAIIGAFSICIFGTFTLEERLKAKPYYVRASARVVPPVLTASIIFVFYKMGLEVDRRIFIYNFLIAQYLVLIVTLILFFVKIRRQMKEKGMSFLEWLKSDF